MKRHNIILLLTAVVLSAVSCQKEPDTNINEAKELTYMEFSSLTTKTLMDDSHKVHWKSSDHIGVFSNGNIYDFTTEHGGENTVFTGEIEVSDAYYAVYPYDASATISSNVITAMFPSEQIAVKGSFADGANITVAKASGTLLDFKNVAGLLQFEITRSDISSVTFTANNGQYPAGKVAVTVSDTPSWTDVEGSASVTLSASEGVLEPGVYYMAVLPQTYEGFTLTLTNNAGQTYAMTVEKPLEIHRASGKNLQKIDANAAFAEANIYEIDLSAVDFSESYIYEAKDPAGNIVAIICKEYLKASNQQAVVVYGTKQGSSSMVMDSSNPVGLVARVLKSAPAEDYVNYTDVPETDPVHGGTYSFKSDVMAYTAEGNAAALSTVYATYDSEAQVSVITSVADENASAATLSPRTITLSDRGDSKAYKLVKIGRQIWFAENVETLKYSDGTPITEATDLYNTEGAAYVNPASTNILYNVAAATSATFTPAGTTAWKIPTASDFKNLVGYVAKSCMLTSYNVNEKVVGNNITCFSITVRGRVTNKGWLATEDSNGDPWFCSSSASSTVGKQQCLVVRMHEAKAYDAPSVNSGQNKKFGYWVRFMRGLY